MRTNRGDRHRWRYAVGAACLVGLSALHSSAAAAGSSGSVDAPVDAGSVVITEPENLSLPIVAGDSNTVFSLLLPEGSACPGDSLGEDWRVQSFLVPATDDPGTLRYGIIRPDGDGRRALYSATTRPFIHILTGRAIAPGEPGPIVQPSPMTFSVYPSGALSAGRYRLGVACTKYRETAAYWDTEIVISDAPEIEPGGFRWTLAEDALALAQQSTSPAESQSWAPIFVGLTAVGVVAFAAKRRWSTRSDLTPQEQT